MAMLCQTHCPFFCIFVIIYLIYRLIHKTPDHPSTLLCTAAVRFLRLHIKTQLDESSEVDKNSGVDRNSVKLVDESSVVVQNTGLKLEGLDEKAVVDQRVFFPKKYAN